MEERRTTKYCSPQYGTLRYSTKKSVERIYTFPLKLPYVMTGKPLSPFRLPLSDFLLFTSAGGLKLVSSDQRITLNNTLDERLWLLEDRVGHAIHPSLIRLKV